MPAPRSTAARTTPRSRWSTARKDLPAATVDKFAKAFLALDVAKAEDKVVLDLQGAKKFVPANAADFDVIEKVGRSTGLLK